MKLAATVLLALAASPALALSQAERMAIRSGEVIGAAAGCGVPEARLVAVGGTTIDLIREVARTPSEATRARKLHERTISRVSANMARHQDQCATALADFERAEAPTWPGLANTR